VRAFFDTNILIYAQGDDAKGRRAREILAQGGFTSGASLAAHGMI
jgi:predicted nucleic acid-binding protein